MNYPKISIITPSYNQGQFIEETILSVIGQRYPNLEYIVMDGGSKDETVDIIKKYEDHIHYWVSAPDGGQAQAINKGFELATGDILAWLNSDDSYLPGTLKKMANLVSKGGDGIYFGNVINYKRNRVWGSNVLDWHNSIDLAYLDYIIQPSSFWTKSVWDKVGELNEGYHFVFDWEWFIRARKESVPFYPVQDILSMYRYHDEHKTSTGGDLRQKEILDLYREEIGEEFYNYCLHYEKAKGSLSQLHHLLGKLRLSRIRSLAYHLLYPKLFRGRYSAKLDAIKVMLGS